MNSVNKMLWEQIVSYQSLEKMIWLAPGFDFKTDEPEFWSTKVWSKEGVLFCW